MYWMRVTDKEKGITGRERNTQPSGIDDAGTKLYTLTESYIQGKFGVGQRSGVTRTVFLCSLCRVRVI